MWVVGRKSNSLSVVPQKIPEEIVFLFYDVQKCHRRKHGQTNIQHFVHHFFLSLCFWPFLIFLMRRWCGTISLHHRTKAGQSIMHTFLANQAKAWKGNIAKGRTAPRVEFISQDHSSQFTNFEHITISESRLSINFKISTKHQHLD